jgi:hypothetical protein
VQFASGDRDSHSRIATKQVEVQYCTSAYIRRDTDTLESQLISKAVRDTLTNLLEALRIVLGLFLET